MSMQSEQQQRIMGYFIEEAKDHLNTLEAGLLNLQSTIEDKEITEEVFRAAHSVKGGAAMLGLSSIQHTAHRLEDYIKVLRECPVKVDQKLETFFLRVFDTLQELLDQLQGPFGLTEEKSEEIMTDVEPVFTSLNEHLMLLVSKSGKQPPKEVDLSLQAVPAPSPQPKPAAPQEEESALLLVFRSDVPGHLRSMLQLFRQSDNASTREQLQTICRKLSQAGEQFDLSQWCNLISAAQKAIASSDNSYRDLAPVLIKDIKSAQELVLSGKARQITGSDALMDLVPAELPDLDLGFDDADADIDSDLDSLFADADAGEVTSGTIDFDFFSGTEPDASATSGMLSFDDLTAINDTNIIEREDINLATGTDSDDDDWFTSGLDASGTGDRDGAGTADVEDVANAAPTNGTANDRPDLIDALEETSEQTLAGLDATGPEVGAAELNTLADLFEGESLDLGAGWQEEEVMADEGSSLMDDDLELEPTSDFSDLLFDQDSNGSVTETPDAPIASGSAPEEGAIALGGVDDADLDDLAGLEGLENWEDLTATDASPDDNSENLESENLELDSLDSEFDNLFEDPLFEDRSDAAADDASANEIETEILGLDLESSSEAAVDLSDRPATSSYDGAETLELDSELDGLGSEFDDLFDNAADASVDDASVDDASTDEIETDVLGLDLESSSEAAADLDDLFGESTSDLDAIEAESDRVPESASTERTIELPVDGEPDETSAMFGDLLSDAEAIASLEEDLNLIDDDIPSAPVESEDLDDLDVDLWGDSQTAATDSSNLDIDQMFGSDDDVEMDAWSTDTDLDITDLDTSFEGALFDEDEVDDGPEQSEQSDENFFDDLDTLGETEPSAESDELGDLNLDFLDEPDLDEETGAIAADASEMDTVDTVDTSDLFNAVDTSSFVEGLFAEEDTAAIDAAQQDADELDLSGLDLEALPDDDSAIVPEADRFETAYPEADHSEADHSEADSEAGLDILDELDDLLADDSAVTETGLDLDLDFDVSDEEADAHLDDAIADEFADLDALLDEPEPATANETSFDELDALLDDSDDPDSATSEDFSDLEALLGDDASGNAAESSVSAGGDDLSEFDDLEKLLEDADKSLGGVPTAKGARRVSPSTPSRRTVRRGHSDQTMRVSVKNLDNLNNLIGELVVNRNSLEQTQERLRQFLDNLLYQVQQLSDVGQRMRDLYERSLLESSLLSNRKNYFNQPVASADSQSHATGASFDALEMDRFTGFHTLSQEMIELIVRVRESASDIDFVVDESDQITRTFRQVTTQLQEGLTRSRMVPFAQTADRLPRAVRDISLRCGKQAELVVEGRDTLIDKMILESLYDPMTHLVNNAITHGIETPEERAAADKPPIGQITIRSFHQGNQTVISISDDGAGIDAERVKAKAIQKGLITRSEAAEMSQLDVYDLLFHSGFSTRDKADDFAGRGVGMDVVRTNLTEIRGTINTDSAIGKGTTFTIRLPLTLSISKALCCISNRARIAFPMDGVEDMIDVPRDRIQQDDEGQSCITWREMLLPFQPLSELLSHNRSLGRGSVYGGSQEDEMVSVIVLRSAGNFLALQVDQVLGEQEIVIKQLEGPVPKPVGIAGATVLGDGRIMPIADVLELIDLSMGRIRRDSSSSLWAKDDIPSVPEGPPTKTEPTVLIVDDSITVRELLSMTFNKVGYRVEQARDGQEAWEKLRSGLPCDLVFCDIEMPRMDGLELLSRIQKDSNLSGLPIAMLTSRGADRHRQMAITLGAKGYFTKPYLEEALLDAAQRMLKGEVLVGSGS